MVPLKSADTHSLSSSHNNPLKTNTNSKTILPPDQTLYQPRTTPNIGTCASLPPSSFVPAMFLMNSPPVITQHYTITFVARNKNVESFDGPEQQTTAEEESYQYTNAFYFGRTNS